MKRIKKPVVKEVQDEILAIEITEDEFADIAAQECAKALAEHDDGDFGFALLMSIAFADFSARLMHRLFDDESEDKAEAEG